MIVPVRPPDPETSETRRRLRRARQLVAATFFKGRRSADTAPSIPSWRAWVFTGWLILVTAVYFAEMAGLL